MSTLRAAYLDARNENQDVQSDEYDSDEERYQRKRQRLLKKVAESAAAIRAINEWTKPFRTGSWRLEREEQERERKLQAEQKAKENSAVISLTPSKENQSFTLKKISNSFDGNNEDDNSCKIWSPLKHTTSNGVQSVIEMEKTPTWNPLRKSKARHSLALFSTDNKPKLSSDQDDDPSTACQPLHNEESDLEPPQKSLEETRTPLRTVVTLNRAQESRKSFSSVCETTSTASSSEDVTPAARSNKDVDFKDKNDALCATPSTLSDCQLETPVKRVVKTFKSPVRISPILLQAFGEERARIRGSIGSPDKVVNLDECTSPKDPSKVLRGVVAYVEVRRGEDDRTAGFQWKLKELGATVSENLNKKVTHVVFQEGLLSTFRKAKQIGAHIVSTHWVMACDESFTKAQESRYPIEKLSRYEDADPLQKTIKRPKVMSPDLGSGRDSKVLMKRLQRRSIKVNSPLTQSPSFTIPVIKTPSPVKSRFTLRRSIISSPSSKDAAGEDAIDDYDGFLAMVEAQVREKAELKRKSGEMNGPPLDFETRLNLLLGRSDADSQDQQKNPPFASIFLKNKPSAGAPAVIKKSPKKGKISKPSLPPAASTSVMKNWLQRCSSEAGQHATDSSVSAAEAASAAADKILDSMFKGSMNEMFSKITKNSKVNDTCTSNFNFASETDSTTRKKASTNINKKSQEDVSEKPSKLTAVLENKSSKVSSMVTKTTKSRKSGFQGNEAASSAMRNWLMPKKSPSKSKSCTALTSPSKVGEKTRKRKACPLKEAPSLSVIEAQDSKKPSQTSQFHFEQQMTPKKKVESSFLDGEVSSLFNRDINFSESSLAERTPQKKENNSCPTKMSPSHPSLGSSYTFQQSPLKRNDSATKSKGKKIESVPRRRSLRLTPVKMTSPLKNISQLETLEEYKEVSHL